MKFSIAIPVFKAKFFTECIESVLSQKYQDFELLILNDASPDDFDSIMDKYKDKRIHYFRNEKNCGAQNVVDNWNKLLEKAKGDFIVNMGDDDKLSPDYLSVLNELIDKYPNVDIFHARVMGIDEESRPFSVALERIEYESPCTFILERFRGGVQFIGDFCIRRSRLIENEGYAKTPFAWCSDDITSFECCIPNGVVHTKDPLFFYRSNPLTISSSKFNLEKLEGVLRERKWLEKFVATYQPKNEEENLLFEAVKKEYPHFISDKETLYFARHLAEKKINLFYFNRVRKQFHINKETAHKTAFMALGHIAKALFT